MSVKITDRKQASAAKTYYRADEPTLARESGGKLLGHLGLDAATLDELSFNRLIDNQTEGGKSITRNNAPGRVCMTDITVGVPKSVTLALVFGQNPDAIMAAVFKTIHTFMERDVEPLSAARVRVNGKDEDRVTGNLAYQADFHLLARPEKGRICPHAHAHIKVPNITFDPAEGKYKALKTLEVHRQAPALQAAFLKELRQNLNAAGYRTVRKAKSFEMEGVGRATISKFSERRNTIKDWVKKHAGKGKGVAAVITREEKPVDLDMEKCRAGWRGMLTRREANVFKRLQSRPKLGRPPQRAIQHVETLRNLRHVEAVSPGKDRGIDYHSR